MPDQQRDNDTLEEKLSWRREALRLVATEPVALECYGGWGLLGRELYRDIRRGVVMEKASPRCALLAELRPTWSVYEGDTIRMLRVGAGRHLTINYLDVDPYGSPWETLHAFFESTRPFAQRMVVVAHDGIHRLVQMGRAWSVEVLDTMVREFGNSHVKEHYGAVSLILLGDIAEVAGYDVVDWRWAAGGDRKKNAHWLAVLEQRSGQEHHLGAAPVA